MLLCDQNVSWNCPLLFLKRNKTCTVSFPVMYNLIGDACQVIVSWNGLVISSFARASRILRTEAEGTKFHFPVVGSDVSYAAF